MIKTIIFDNQGVLTDRDKDGTIETLAKSFRFDYDKVKPVYENYRDKIDLGEMSAMEFYRSLTDHIDDVDDPKVLMDFHASLYPVRTEVVEFAKSLKENYNVALLTNFCDKFHEFNKVWKLDEFIASENTFVSAELKMKKPDKNIYYHVLEALGNQPEEVIFIDDNIKNVEAASKLGINAIRFETLKQVKKDLEKILETVNVG